MRLEVLELILCHSPLEVDTPTYAASAAIYVALGLYFSLFFQS